jgi:hypothetical protein|tara:strand:+ start:577 stop:1152 length:576 start_codon:yes stop_codon:yes gene_type:complete
MSVILKKFKLNSYAFVFQMKEHKKIKDKLLDLINITDQHTIKPDETCNDFISKTDWKFSKIPERLYAMEFSKILEPYITKMLLELSMDEATIHNMWFQSYHKKDTHNWHIHEGTHWTNIYFLQLPDKNFRTELYDSFDKKIINNIEIKEGTLLSFPANILHRSPKNTSNKVKTIISFNTTFSNTKQNLIQS